MEDVKELKSLVEAFLKEEAPVMAELSASKVEVLPPIESEAPEASVEPEVQPTEENNSYPQLNKIEPKNPRAKAAYIEKATSNGTTFILVVEELGAPGSEIFTARSGIACIHDGKTIFAASSFPQMSRKPIPMNRFKMNTTSGSGMPAWLKSYLEG